MSNQYIIPELSKLIASKVPEVETEWDSTGRNKYRLDGVIRAIRAYGEKLKGAQEAVDESCYDLLTAYLASDCDMQSEEVEDVIRSIFT